MRPQVSLGRARDEVTHSVARVTETGGEVVPFVDHKPDPVDRPQSDPSSAEVTPLIRQLLRHVE